MSLRTGENGELLLLSDGRLLEVDENGDGCCCGGDDGPMCCYNDQCQVVPCDSPDAVGGITGCDPCQIDFCGYCPSSSATSVPVSESVNILSPSANLSLGICDFVETDSATLTASFEGVTSSGNPRGPLLIVTTQDLVRLSFSLLSRFDNSSGQTRLSFDVDSNITNDTNTIITANSIPNGSAYTASLSMIVYNVVWSPLPDCEFQISYDYDISLTLDIPSIGFSETVSDTQSDERIHQPVACADGQITTQLTGDTSFLSSAVYSLDITQKPFIQQNPTCIT